MLTLVKTKKFSVFDLIHNTIDSHIQIVVYLDLNCEYTSDIVKRLLKRRNSFVQVETDFSHLLRLNFDSIDILQICDFENIHWDEVLNGSQRASSYIVRKGTYYCFCCGITSEVTSNIDSYLIVILYFNIRIGLSRKAQLALQIKRYTSKHPSSILTKSVPYTLIIETWNAFEDMKIDFGFGMITSFDNISMIQMSFRQRLEFCLEDIREEMESRQHSWILKPSVTNKGANIAIIANYNELIDNLESLPDIREWVLQR